MERKDELRNTQEEAKEKGEFRVSLGLLIWASVW